MPVAHGVCFERSPSGSPGTAAHEGERVPRRHERTLLSDEEIGAFGRRTADPELRLPSGSFKLCLRQPRPTLGAPVCAFTGPRAQPSPASPRATARSRPRESQACALRLNGRLRVSSSSCSFKPRASGGVEIKPATGWHQLEHQWRHATTPRALMAAATSKSSHDAEAGISTQVETPAVPHVETATHVTARHANRASAIPHVETLATSSTRPR
jgi:hypothetical protein